MEFKDQGSQLTVLAGFIGSRPALIFGKGGYIEIM